jgi:hypothetical protein
MIPKKKVRLVDHYPEPEREPILLNEEDQSDFWIAGPRAETSDV